MAAEGMMLLLMVFFCCACAGRAARLTAHALPSGVKRDVGAGPAEGMIASMNSADVSNNVKERPGRVAA
jgi:hypothetical protein